MTTLGPTMVRQSASDAGSWLIVAECFGVETPTFQGEGPSCGHPALFIRLSRCNLTCFTRQLPCRVLECRVLVGANPRQPELG